MIIKQNVEQIIKDEVWENLKVNFEVLEKLKNLFLLGSFGIGKFLFINIVIIILMGKNDYYVDIGCGSKYNIIRFQRQVIFGIKLIYFFVE